MACRMSQEPVVEIRRSARRRRTVAARREGDRIIVMLPEGTVTGPITPGWSPKPGTYEYVAPFGPLPLGTPVSWGACFAAHAMRNRSDKRIHLDYHARACDFCVS